MSESRAAARRNWPVRVVALQAPDASDDLSASTTPEQRLAMMEPLAREAWELTGAPVPDYARAEAPIVVRPLRPE